MKRLLLPFVMVVAFVLQAFNDTNTDKIPASPASIGEIVYVVQLKKQVGVQDLQKDWRNDYLNPGANDSLFAPLFDKIRRKELDVFSPRYPFTEKLTKDSAVATISVPFTALVENEFTFEWDTVHGIDNRQPEDVVAIIFHEEWFYDEQSLTLEKKVKGIIPVIDYGYFNNGESYGQMVRPMCYIPFNGNEVSVRDFSSKEITYDFLTDSVRMLDYLQENKVVTRSWCGIPDFSSVKEKLVGSLKMQSANASNSLYNVSYPYTPVDKKSRKQVVTQINAAGTTRFNESWSADLSTMTFVKVVKGVYFGNDLGPKSPELSEVSWENIYQFYAYLPLNKTTPLQAASGSVLVENYYTEAYYSFLLDNNKYVWSKKDSAAIDAIGRNAGIMMRNGNLAAYNTEEAWKYDDPLDKRRVALTPAEIYDMYVDSDMVWVEDPDNPTYQERIVTRDIGHDSYCGLNFAERWRFDPLKATFTKDVKKVGVMLSTWMMLQEMYLAQPFLSYDNPTLPLDSVFQPKYLMAKNVVTPCLLNYFELRMEEGDGKYYAAYANTYDENVSNELRYQMVQQVIDLVLAGKMTAWSDEEKPRPLSIPEFQHRMDSCAQETHSTPVRGREYYLFNELRFDEDWYYNARTGQVYKKVNSITFAHRYYSLTEGNPYYAERPRVFPGYFTIKVNGTK